MDLVFAAATLLAFYILLRRIESRPDASEPPLISSKIPLVGHLFGLIWHVLPYYTQQRFLSNPWLMKISTVSY